MKAQTILALIVITFALTAAGEAQAANYSTCKPAPKKAKKVRVVECPPYRVSTCEVSRCKQQRMATDECGSTYCYWVTVITYRDTYSNGATKTYTRVFRA